MTYRIGYSDVEIPEIDAFLDEYDALCAKHGIEFNFEKGRDCDGDPTGHVTISAYSGDDDTLNAPELDMEEADRGVPFIGAAYDKGHAEYEKQYAAERAADAATEAARRRAQEDALKSAGVVLSDGRYKLVRVD